jgi:hypothetical protein
MNKEQIKINERLHERINKLEMEMPSQDYIDNKSTILEHQIETLQSKLNAICKHLGATIWNDDMPTKHEVREELSSQ